jgi:hypothetical protein
MTIIRTGTAFRVKAAWTPGVVIAGEGTVEIDDVEVTP